MHKLLWEELYEKVHDDIVNLRIRPGEKISEAKIAARYNVSRGPVRNVIRKLQDEGFVVIKPQSGTVVLPISKKSARDILQIRLLLEPFAAEKAAARITDEDLETLGAAFDKLAPLPSGTIEKGALLREVDGLLHRVIWNCCGNREIAPILKKYLPAIRRTQLATLGLKLQRMVPSESEMREIFAALAARDPERAREAMREHIENINEALDP